MTIPEDIYEPCPCASGKKYKFCCYQKDRQAANRNGFETGDILRVWTDWLGREWNNVNHYYRLNLSRPVITIARYQGKHGHWDPVTQTISIGIETIKQYPWHVVVDILKHEMAHQYVSTFFRIGESEHGPYFRRACELMGLPDWAAAATGELPREIHDWRKGSLTEEEKRLLDKTNKLLALAQSDNEHEAALAMQRVRELYAKYNLDQVEKRKEAQFVSWVFNFKSKRIEGWQSLILVILDKHFFVRTISFSEFDPIDLVQYKAVEIIGKKENVLMAEYVYQFLERTVHALWEKHLNEKSSLEDLPHATLRSEKRHFMIGVLDGFMEKLDQTNGYQNLGRSESECKSLVKTADKELDEFYRRKYPRTSTRSGGGFNPDRETYKSGVSEGQKIRLHKPVTGQDGYRGNLLTS